MKNKRYRLERSQDGNTYASIAAIAAKGTSNERSDYSYTDLTPMKGINYYRLVQEDIDGHESILGIKAVNTGTGNTTIRVYPNPAHAELYIDLGRFETTQKYVEIYNVSGKTVFNKILHVENGVIKITLDQHLGAGIYLVKIGDKDHVRVVIQ